MVEALHAKLAAKDEQTEILSGQLRGMEDATRALQVSNSWLFMIIALRSCNALKWGACHTAECVYIFIYIVCVCLSTQVLCAHSSHLA